MINKELEKQGEELEQIFKTMDISAHLKECTSNELVDRFEFTLIQLKDFARVKKAVEIMRVCLHKDITQVESQEYHFAIEIKKEKKTLDLLEYKDKYTNESQFSALLGIDNNNSPIFFDLQKATHTLIGGATGMGKTSILNNIIYSLTKQNTPKELGLYLIDIKKTLTMWDNLPHLALKPLSTAYDALYALRDISKIMDKRFKELSKQKKAKADPKDYPYIVVVIDELADLMLSGLEKYIEREIVHIAQVGRSVNVALILATQNPIVKVCTSNIKANCPTRIALYTTSTAASRVILDNKKASDLDGVGWAIIQSADNPIDRMFKACYLTEEQIKEYLKEIKK